MMKSESKIIDLLSSSDNDITVSPHSLAPAQALLARIRASSEIAGIYAKSNENPAKQSKLEQQSDGRSALMDVTNASGPRSSSKGEREEMPRVGFQLASVAVWRGAPSWPSRPRPSPLLNLPTKVLENLSMVATPSKESFQA